LKASSNNDDMITARELSWGLVIPAVTVLALLLAGRIGRKPGWGGVAALAIGFAISFCGIIEIAGLPPHRGQDWLLWMIVPAAVLGWWDSSGRVRFRLIFGFVLFFFVVLSLLAPLNRSMQSQQIWAWTIALAFGITAWWWLNDALATVRTGALVPALYGFMALALALAMVNNGQQEFGKLAAIVALFFWIIAIVDGIFGQSSLAHGGMPVAVTIVVGLLIIGSFYGDVTIFDASFLAIAPLVAWLGELPGVRRRAPLRLIAATIPALILIAYVAVPNATQIRRTMDQQFQIAE
jgi:hypothetical protein